MGKEQSGNLKQLGLDITRNSNGTIAISQKEYIENLPRNSLLSDERALKSVLGKLEWSAQQTRPDILYDMVHIRENWKTCPGDAEKVLEKLIRKLSFASSHSVIFNNLKDDFSGWKLVVFADASFANSVNCSTQGAFIIFIFDSVFCCPIAWQSKKLTRVVHSTLAAETLSLAAAVDSALYLQTQLKEIIFKKLSIYCYSDNRSLVTAVRSTKPVLEKRLRIDIAGLSENLEKTEISDILWIDTTFQLANSLTKRNCTDKFLLKCLADGEFTVPLNI